MKKTFKTINNDVPRRVKQIAVLAMFCIVSIKATFASNYSTFSSGKWGKEIFDGSTPGDLVSLGDTVYVNHSISIDKPFTVKGILIIAKEGSLISSEKLFVDGDFINYGSAEFKGLNIKGILSNTGTIETEVFELLGGTVNGGGTIHSGFISMKKGDDSKLYMVKNQTLDTTGFEEAVVSLDGNGTIDYATVSYSGNVPQMSIIIAEEEIELNTAPTTNTVYINMDELSELNKVFILNAAGEKVHEVALIENTAFDSELALAEMNAGVYYAVSTTSKGKQMRKIVKP